MKLKIEMSVEFGAKRKKVAKREHFPPPWLLSINKQTPFPSSSLHRRKEAEERERGLLNKGWQLKFSQLSAPQLLFAFIKNVSEEGSELASRRFREGKLREKARFVIA
jgi:hypothetical protein